MDSNIYNLIENNGNLYSNTCSSVSYELTSLGDVLSKTIESSNLKQKTVKLYLESLYSVCTGTILKSLYDLLEDNEVIIYTNDISFRDLLKESYKDNEEEIFGKKIKVIKVGEYECEELYLTKELVENDISYTSELNLLNELYHVDENSTNKRKFKLYFYTNDKVSKIFDSFINSLSHNPKVVSLFNKVTLDPTAKLDKSSDVFPDIEGKGKEDYGIEAYADILINDLKKHIIDRNKVIEKKYQMKIEISDDKYDRIKETLVEYYDTILHQSAYLKHKNATRMFYDTASIIIKSALSGAVSSVGLLMYMINEVMYIKDIFYANKSENILRTLLSNNVLFYKFIETLGSDLLFVLNYKVGISGTYIEVVDESITILPYMMDAYSNFPSYTIHCSNIKTNETASVNQPVHAGIYSEKNMLPYDGNEISSKELMFLNNLKSLKYLLYIETPHYFIPYMDKLLKENFNIKSSDNAKYNTTGKNINLLVLTSLLDKWQEKYVKNQLSDKYGAVPVRYSVGPSKQEKKRNNYFENYKDYDIILKNSAITDKPASKITFLTCFNYINAVDLQHKLTYVVNEAKEKFDKLKVPFLKYPFISLKFNTEKYWTKFVKINYSLRQLDDVENMFEKFANDTTLINKKKDMMSNIISGLTDLQNFFDDLKKDYDEYLNEIVPFPKEELEKLSEMLKYYRNLLSLIQDYFFSKQETTNIKIFKRDYELNIKNFLKETIVKKQVCSIIEYRYDYNVSLWDKISHYFRANITTSWHDDVYNLIELATSFSTKLNLNIIRYYTMRLHYKIDNNLDELERVLKGSMKTDEVLLSMDYNFLEKIGMQIWRNVEHQLEAYKAKLNKIDGLKIDDSHAKCSYVLKKQFFLHLLVDDDLLNRGLDEYEDKLFYIVLAVYFTTKCHNHLLQRPDYIDEFIKQYKEKVFIDAINLYVFEELYIIANELYDAKVNTTADIEANMAATIEAQVKSISKSVQYSGHGAITMENVFEFRDISEKYIEMLEYFMEQSYKLEYLEIPYNTADEYVYKKSMNGYGSSLYKNYKGEKNKPDGHHVDIGSPSFGLSVYDGQFSVINVFKYTAIILKEGISFGTIKDAVLELKTLSIFTDPFKYAFLVEQDLVLQTINEDNIERYMSFVKYTHLISSNQKPLVRASSKEVVLPGEIYNNMLLFDYSYGIFGGSRLDMSSYVDIETTYANVFNSDVIKDIFTKRIETLILGTKYNRNTVYCDFWNSIEDIKVDKNKDNKDKNKDNDVISEKNRDSDIDTFIKKRKLVEKSVNEYKRILKSKLEAKSDYRKLSNKKQKVRFKKELGEYKDAYTNTLVELLQNIFNVGHFLKNKIDNNAAKLTAQDDSQYCSEESRAKLYQSFTEAMHGIGKCNMRSIYIEDFSEVTSWSFKDDDWDPLNIKISSQNINVCHLDYAGIVSLLPIESSEYMR